MVTAGLLSPSTPVVWGFVDIALGATADRRITISDEGVPAEDDNAGGVFTGVQAASSDVLSTAPIKSLPATDLGAKNWLALFTPHLPLPFLLLNCPSRISCSAVKFFTNAMLHEAHRDKQAQRFKIIFCWAGSARRGL